MLADTRAFIAQVGSTIPPSVVRDYATSHGWQMSGRSRFRRWIFNHPDANLRQLIIPMDREKEAGWSEALYEVVIRLASVEQVSPETVINKLLSSHADAVRFRISEGGLSNGMLPMNDAVELISGIKKALLASASTVVNPVPHHPRLSRTEAEEFLQSCKMGQTEIGSYIVKVLCPLREMPLIQDKPPFARSVTTVLIKSCANIVDSIEKDSIEKMIEDNRKNPIVTSNLCDALVKMHAARENADLTIAVSWAVAMRKYAPPNVPQSVTFKPEYFPSVERISQELRPLALQETHSTFYGTVETLNGTVGEDGKRSGEVVLALLLSDEEILKARVNLSVEEYAKAVSAHEKGVGYVSITGILQRGARTGYITNIKDFSTL